MSSPGSGPTRDLTAAKTAYSKGDIELSIQAHDSPHAGNEHHAGDSGDFIKSLVFGGLDGIITTFAIVCAAVGANLGNKTVIVMGLANLVADAISMGLGDALSENAEIQHLRNEYNREDWEMTHHPEGEKKELVELYVENGVEQADAELIINTMSKYRKFFVRHMMVVELGLMPPEDDENPWLKGAVTFVAFMIFGSVPLLSFVIFANVGGVSDDLLFGLCILFTGVAIFTLGILKGKFAQTPMIMSGLSMFGNGALAASASYFIGWALESLVSE